MTRLATIIVLVSACACAEPTPEPRAAKPQGQAVDPRARVLLEQAQKAISASDVEAASRYLREVERYHRDLPEVDFLRGHIALVLRDLDSAEEAFRRVLAQYPKYEAAAHSIGDVAYQAGRYREAIQWYLREDEIRPRAETWLNIGNTYVALEKPDSARAAYERTLDLDPDYAPGHFALSRVFEDEGRYDEALGHARKAAALEPQNYDYQYATGSVLLQLGRLEEAEGMLEEVVTKRPWDYSAHYALAQVYQRSGRPDEAAQMMQRADDARARESNLRATQRTARAFRDSVDAQIALAEGLVKAGRIDEAINAYNVALLLNPNDLVVRQNLAALYLHKGDVQESIVRASDILARDSLHVQAWVILSASYARQGDLGRSEDAWRRAQQIDPNHPSILRALRQK